MNEDSLPAVPTGNVADGAVLDLPNTSAAGQSLDSIAGGYSFFDLFLDADPVVKLVILLLLGASIWSWAIIIEKGLKLWRINQRMTLFEKAFHAADSFQVFLDNLTHADSNHPMGALLISLARDVGKESVHRSDQDLRRRYETLLAGTLGREMEILRKDLDFLATVGSSAPFIGLFGTVWGIMNSFQAIGFSKNTSLAVVAPGIAEALFATALGLVAAIPAVIGYNRINHVLRRMENRMVIFADELLLIFPLRLVG